MALEPETVTAEADDNPELRDMTRRFWWGVLLGVPLMAVAMLHMVGPWAHAISPRIAAWIEFALATPIVLWAGWPFFQRGWASVKFRSPNMFTLIAMGVGVAYGFSAVATLAPHVFPESLRGTHGQPAVYFEAAAAIIVLVSAWASAGAEGTQPHQQRHPSAARPFSQDGPRDARRRQRVRHRSRPGTAG